jgi:Tfp pilus assembly protein PilX
VKRQQFNVDADFDDRGASLMLALMVMLVTSLVVISMVTWIGNSLLDTVKFQQSTNSQYAQAAAVQTEIQLKRYNQDGVVSYTTRDCTPGSSGTFTFNSVPVKVWCSMTYHYSADTRDYIMTSCSSSMSQTDCLASPSLQVDVQFNDFSPTIINYKNCYDATHQSTCGTAMLITSWVVG